MVKETTMPEHFGRVAVLMGGLSAEREVSLKSGAAVLAALLARGVDAQGVDVGEDGVARLQAGGFDHAFIALHGRGGEDGVIQGVLEALRIPYTGSGVLGSALSMDKLRSKQVWQAADLPTPPFERLNADSHWDTVASRLGLPLAVKPVCEGSSFGITRVERSEDLPMAWRAAVDFDEAVMAESWIAGGEYTVAILAGEALPVIRLETPRAFYDYAAKYQTDDTGYHCPSGLDHAMEQRLQALALRAFDLLAACGWGRVDVMVDEQGNPWLLENNTVPGMTNHSLVPMAAAAAGIQFEELVWRILADARRESGHGRAA
jgi:D-alanine-D-alanine ligase